MSSLPSFLLHGVQYEVCGFKGSQKGCTSTNFSTHHPIELPSDFDIKDPEVLLEECTVSLLLQLLVLVGTD